MKAKRYIAVLCLLSFVLCSIKAQPRLRTPEYYLGFHGGVSASSVIFNPKLDNMSPITKACVLGGNGGLVFRYAGHKYCALQTELNYVHRGWAEKNDSVGKYSRSLHYIEIPLLMHLYVGSDKAKWIFNLGPQIGYCIKDDGNHGELVNSITTEQYGSLKHKFDWGLLVGTGFYIQSKHAGLYQLEIRFDYSFGGIFSTNATDHFDMASPIDLSINLGWLFPVRKKMKGERKKEIEN